MPMTSGMQAQRLERLKRRYPFVYTRELTKTAGGRSICAVQLGLGDTKVLLTGGTTRTNTSRPCSAGS